MEIAGVRGRPAMHFFVVFVLFFLISCTSQPTDLRTLVPGESLAYLETNDLKKTLESITENEAFKKHATPAYDFSVIQGMQVAVAITDLETSEQKVTSDQSVLNFTPKFVAVAETHGWSWQVRSLVENQVDAFVKKAYGKEADFQSRETTDTTRYTWTSGDGRKVFAVVSETQIFFGNDEDAINKALLAKQGNTENLTNNQAMNVHYGEQKDSLAFGYFSRKFIERVSDVFGISVAVNQTEDENTRGIISSLIPKLARNLAQEIVWSANSKDGRIADKIFIKTKTDTSAVLSETILPSGKKVEPGMYDLLPPDAASVTSYKLKNPQVAFRSVLLVAARNVDTTEGRVIGALSNSFLEPYGVTDAEGFLSVIDSEIVTAQLGSDGEETLAIVKVKDFEKVRPTLTKEIIFDSRSVGQVPDEGVWKSKSGEFSAALIGGFLVLGSDKSVSRTIEIRKKRKISPAEKGKDSIREKYFSGIPGSDAPVATFTRNDDLLRTLVELVGNPKNNSGSIDSVSLTETIFTKQGFERRYLSDFGMIGRIISQFETE